MRMCYQYLLLAGLTFFASQGLAQGQLVEEIRCTNNDCLTSGYEKYDAGGNLVEVGICNLMDCEVSGWEVFRLSGLNSRIICTNSSCYGEGFTEINSDDSSVVSIRSCNSGGCFSNGWIDHTFIPAESIEGIQCDAQGCEFGFLIEELEEVMQDNQELRQKLEARKSRLEARIAKLEQHQQKLKDRIHKQKNKKCKKKHKLKKFFKVAKLVKRYFKIEARIQKLQEKLAQVQAQLDDIEDPGVVINSQQAVCLSQGGCFTDGYQVIE